MFNTNQIKMENQKIRIGNGKKQSEKWLKSSICLTDIPAEHTFEYNGKLYVKVDINVYPEPNKFGKDVSITVDTYKKEQKSKNDDLPFG
jgi:hypothetical protein